MTKKLRNIIILIIIIVAVAIIAVIGFAALKVNKTLDQIQTVELEEEEIEVNELEEEVIEVEDHYTTIAIFGLDNRTMGSLDRGLSDVIMIVSIDEDSKEMQMVSVYRDTYLNTSPNSGDAYQKANAAYANGGPERAISMLNTNLDLDIDNYVTVNFRTVADCVDAIGGVEINIDSYDELQWLNFYIDHTNEIMHTSAPHVSGTGPQILNGIQSVAYGRIRYTAGGDFGRAERHRTVLTQLFKQAKEADLSTLNNLLEIVCPELQTDLTKTEILSMVKTVLGYDLTNSRGFPFEKNCTMLGAAGSIVVPCDLETNVRELHEYLYGNTEYVPSENVKLYSQHIVSATGMTTESAAADRYEEIDDFSNVDPSESMDMGDFEEFEITEELMDDGYVE